MPYCHHRTAETRRAERTGEYPYSTHRPEKRNRERARERERERERGKEWKTYQTITLYTPLWYQWWIRPGFQILIIRWRHSNHHLCSAHEGIGTAWLKPHPRRPRCCQHFKNWQSMMQLSVAKEDFHLMISKVWDKIWGGGGGGRKRRRHLPIMSAHDRKNFFHKVSFLHRFASQLTSVPRYGFPWISSEKKSERWKNPKKKEQERERERERKIRRKLKNSYAAFISNYTRPQHCLFVFNVSIELGWEKLESKSCELQSKQSMTDYWECQFASLTRSRIGRWSTTRFQYCVYRLRERKKTTGEWWQRKKAKNDWSKTSIIIERRERERERARLWRGGSAERERERERERAPEWGGGRGADSGKVEKIGSIILVGIWIIIKNVLCGTYSLTVGCATSPKSISLMFYKHIHTHTLLVSYQYSINHGHGFKKLDVPLTWSSSSKRFSCREQTDRQNM